VDTQREDGLMRKASDSESELANRILKQKYGLQGKIVRIFNVLRKTNPIVIVFRSKPIVPDIIASPFAGLKVNEYDCINSLIGYFLMKRL
jgi:hypothetical protein